MKAGVETQHAGTGMYVRNATHPTTPVEKAYVPPSLKPTQASLPSALVIPFVEKVQGKGNRAEPIATSSSMASEAINALGPDLLNQHTYTIAQTEQTNQGLCTRPNRRSAIKLPMQ